MYFHTACFEGAKTDSTNNENIPAKPDPAFTVNANSLYLAPTDMEVFAAKAMNDTITRARIVSPSLRLLGLPEIFPLSVSATPTVANATCTWMDNCPVIRQNDEFGVEASNGASTVDTAFAALWLRKSKRPVPAGKRFTIRATSTNTLVANAWTLATLTLDQTPPVGDYAVIGMSCTCNDAFAARLVFPKDTNFRPGVPCYYAVTTFDVLDPFRYGKLGEWGRFHSVNIPQLEVFGVTAGAETPAVILDLVSLGNPG